MRLIIDSDAARMPKNCHQCYLCYGGWCTVMPSEQDEMCPDSDRPEWCPLSEYPGSAAYEKRLAEIVGAMQEEVNEWSAYTDSELADGVTVSCDFFLEILNMLKDRPTKLEIKHAISNTDIPKGMNELDYLELMSNIYTELAKLYGEEPMTYSPS